MKRDKVEDNNVCDENYLGEVIKKDEVYWVESAIQFASNDEFITENLLQDSKPQSLMSQAERREKLVALLTAFENCCKILGDETMEWSTKIGFLKN